MIESSAAMRRPISLLSFACLVLMTAPALRTDATPTEGRPPSVPEPPAPQRRARQICCREQQEIVDGAVDRKGRVEIDGHCITSHLLFARPWTKYSAAGAKNRSQSLPGL